MKPKIDGNTPLTWTRQYGKGKVFYISIGHSVGAVTNRYYQQLILQGLKMAVRRKVRNND